MADRIAAPLPADCTPLGEMPRPIRTQERSVPSRSPRAGGRTSRAVPGGNRGREAPEPPDAGQALGQQRRLLRVVGDESHPTE